MHDSPRRDAIVGYRKEFRHLSYAIAQAIDDLTNKRSDKIPYIVDYGLVSPFVLPGFLHSHSGPERQNPVRNVDFLGLQLFKLFPQLFPALPFNIVFSLPTILELESAILILLGDSSLQTIRDEINDHNFDNLRRIVYDDPNGTYITHDVAAQRLVNIIEKISRTGPHENINSLINLLNSGVLLGLGDVLSRNDVRQIQRIARPKRDRLLALLRDLHRDKQNTPEQGQATILRDFATLMDAANLAFTSESENAIGREVPFLGPLSVRLPEELLKLVGTRRRLPISAVLMLHAAQSFSPDKVSKDEILSKLSAFKDRLSSCYRYVDRVDSYDDLRDAEQDEIVALYRDYMKEFAMDIRDLKQNITKDALREKMKNFNSRFDVISAVEQRNEDTKKALKEWSDARSRIVSEEDYDDFDVRQDPRVQQILGFIKNYDPR